MQSTWVGAPIFLRPMQVGISRFEFHQLPSRKCAGLWGEIDRSGARDKKQRVHPWQDRVGTGVGLPLVLYFKR